MKRNYIELAISCLFFSIGIYFNSFWFFFLAYIISGYHVVFSAIRSIFYGQVFNENFLMSIATIGAFIIGEYSEAVAVILFFNVGEIFQNKAVNKSRKSIQSLLEIRPDYANLVVGDIVTKVDPDEVKIGDTLLIRPGEKIPLDGIIAKGNTTLNTAALTGESIPMPVYMGDAISSGCMNNEGLIYITVTKSYEQSTVSKILELVESASDKKSKTEAFITKFAKYYTPAVVFAALIIAIFPPILLSQDFVPWIYRALTFLVISCPCALVISVPLGFFGGIGSASNNGILIKGSTYLENLSKVSTVVFDKTGTITKGNFAIADIKSEQLTTEKLLEYVAYAEYYSSHPIAKSILAYYNQPIDPHRIIENEEIAGFGVRCVIDDKKILVGNRKLVVDAPDIQFLGTILYVSINDKYMGYIGIKDQIKDHAIAAIVKLKGIQTIMLTGDREEIALDIAKQVGIDQVYSKLLPQDKVQKIEEILEKADGRVVFVGDGINDAPVLTRADIGIAMGGLGSDAAIEASDIVIMDDNLEKIATSIEISKKTLRVVKQNIAISLFVKIGVLVLATVGLSTLWQGIIADVGVALVAILNAVRLIDKKR